MTPITNEGIKIISLKLSAAELLLDNSSDDKDIKISLDFMRRLIGETSLSEPVNDGMLFGEVMALINEGKETLFSRKAYDIDYIYFNSETDQFESYTNGVKTLHGFDTKDYTANDWYIVN